MCIPDWFQTIAEIGIGLAGFSGLVVALRRGHGPLSDVQKFRMGVLFGMTFGALFLALLPYALTELGLSGQQLWNFSATAMIVWSLVFMFHWISHSRRVASSTPEIFDLRAFSTMTVGHIINLTLQVSLLLSWSDLAASGIYGAGLIWYLIHGSQQFVRMLFVQPREDNDK